MIRRFSTQIRDERDQYFGRFYLFEDITARRRVRHQERARLEGDLHQAMKMQDRPARRRGGDDFDDMLGVILGHTRIAMKSVRATDRSTST